jgi:hypothetical protein
LTRDQFRELMGRVTFPAVVKTRGSESYTLQGPHSYRIFEEYPNTVVLAQTGQGVAMVAINAIDSIAHEHEVVPR